MKKLIAVFVHGQFMFAVTTIVILLSSFFYSPVGAVDTTPVAVLVLENATNISVTDSNGNVHRQTDPQTTNSPVEFESLTNSMMFAIASADNGAWKFDFQSQGQPMTIELLAGSESGGATSMVRYYDLSMPMGQKGEMTLSNLVAGDMFTDNDNNGTYETDNTPSNHLSGSPIADINPPTVTVTRQPSSNNVYINTTDSSGVKQTYYTFSDPGFSYLTSKGTLYQGAIDISQFGSPQSIYVLTEDNTGNRSSWEIYDIPSPDSPSPMGLPPGTSEGNLVTFPGDPAIYIISANTLYGFETYQAFRFYEYMSQNFSIKTSSGHASDYNLGTELAGDVLGLPRRGSYAECVQQPYTAGTLVNDSGTIFLVMGCYKIPFHNYSSFTGLGYSLKNVIKDSLAKYNFVQTPGISSAAVPHTWGSWVSYNGTVYYSLPSGMFGVPDYQTFLSNGGKPSLIVKANSYDISVINKGVVGILSAHDSFVSYVNIFGPPTSNPNEPMIVPDENPVTTNRNAQRVADIRQLSSALELYNNDFQQYPASLNDLTPDYISVIPAAPTPPDGSCTTQQNIYTYTLVDATHYQMTFCIGSTTGGLSPGVHTTSQAGIQ